MNKPQFYFGLVLILIAPALSKVPTIFLSEKLEVKAVRIVYKKRHENTDSPDKFTIWKAKLSNGNVVEFEGTRNVVHGSGTVRTAFVNERNTEDSFIYSFAGFYNNFNTIIALVLLVLWLSMFFVFCETDKTWLRVRTIKKWYFKICAVLSIMFLFWYVLILPIWLVFEIGWGALFGYLIISLIILSQLKETIEFLIFSEDKLKERERIKIEKRKKEAREFKAEIMRRRNSNR